MQRFAVAATPRLLFGADEITRIGELLKSMGTERVLVVTSRSLIADADTRRGLADVIAASGIRAFWYRYDLEPAIDSSAASEIDALADAPRGLHREPSPDVVDAIHSHWTHGHDSQASPDAVVAIGGGSALDTGKAVAVRFTEPHPIADLLEGVGTKAPAGTRLPLVAVPTTAGTGSEATKNAVLSQPGATGFKKSLRHDAFVPDVALIDPRLQLATPRAVTAAAGLDAITQLLEAYVSTQATPVTDALALDGLAAAGRGFTRAVERGETDLDARSSMAYAAYLSGVCLASAGLGTVHGLAGVAGALTSVPHGLFCGALVAETVDRTIAALGRERNALGTLGKYAAAGRALTGRTAGSMEAHLVALVDRLREFLSVSQLAPLSTFGVTAELAARIAAEGGNKANPYEFSPEERADLIRAAL